MSYGREDQNKVKEIYDKLSDMGYSPWMDTENLLPGELWLKTISNVFDYCDFFQLCLSPRSVDKRGYLQKEIKDALKIWETKLDCDIFLIPLKLEDNFVVPEDISCFQYISLSHSH